VKNEKILHLIGQLTRGGAERQLLHLAGALRERGWKQTIISFGGGDEWNKYCIQMGIPLYVIPRHPIKPWRLWKLVRVFQREKPALIQTWSSHLAEYTRLAWGKGQAKVIFGVREDFTIDRATGEPRDKMPRLRGLEGADFAIGNSQKVFDNLARRGVRLPPHEVIGNIVYASGRARPGEAVSVPRIVSIGALRRLKAYDILLQAAAILAKTGEKFEVLLIGKGPEQAYLEKLCGELQLRDRVHFLGARDDVPDILAGAHILVHPSKSEGLSNTILEGMAAGLPVVSTWEAAEEIVEHERTGLLVSAGMPAPLAEALKRLLDNPSLRECYGQAALAFVREKFNENIITIRYEHVYQKLLEGRPIS